MKTKIRELEENAWIDFVQKHPSFKFARTCLDNVSPHKFWSISDQYPDLVSRLHVQIRLMGNFGFSAELPWASKADDAICFICKERNDNLYHFLLIVLIFVTILIHFGQIWSLKLQTAILQMAATFLVFLRI